MIASRVRRLALPFAVSAVGIAWVLYQIQPSAIAGAFAKWNIAGVGLALAGLGLGYTARIVRWRFMLLRLAAAPPWGQVAAIYLGSIALNNLLPLRAGDVGRVAWLARAEGVGLARGTVSVALERALDAAALGIVLVLAWPATSPSPEFGLLTLLLGCSVVLTVPWWFPIANRLGTWAVESLSLPRLQQAWARLVGSLEEPLGAFRTLGTSSLLVLLTIIVWSGEALVFAGALTSLGLSWPVGHVLLLTAAATLSTLIPSAPGYVGTFHAAVIWCGRVLGLEPTTAAALAVVAHLMIWLPTSLIGLASLPFLRSSRPELRAEQ